MALLNFLLNVNARILHTMLPTHHILLFGILAYLIRYCSTACYDKSNRPITCITSPVNSALNQHINATNTCGTPPEGYCFIGPQRQCEVCDKNNPLKSHPARNMVDKFSLTNVSWWQSQTWWTSNQLGLSKMFDPLKVNITLTLRKKYLISGGVYVTFKTERPKQMIIERSNDFGKTWHVYQYYAQNCRSAYNLQPDPPISAVDPFKQICSELYSGEFPRSGGVVHFDPRTRYKPADYYNGEVHKYLEATNIRLRLEYPGTDGREYINEESTLNQYFYAINDLRVDARCDCNGHAEFCDILDSYEMCDCKHNTAGTDCEACLPMYRNRMWRPGNATNANPCERCQCFDHAQSCTYSAFLNQGICDNCVHNTRGVRCDQCVEKFYRDMNMPLNDPNVCIPCDCYQPGILDDGKCLQSVSSANVLGQCNCKPGIYGRRCDQCLPGKWGYIVPPVGTCFDCNCNVFGTLHNNQTCDPYNGQCTCKAFTSGRQCDVCKDGYYRFPTSAGTDCIPCPCNLGGANPSCNKVTGICSCKTGVTGPTCDKVQSGFFFPNFTHIKYEPEFSSANGSFSWHFLVRNYARFFTGLGFARLNGGQSISFTFSVPTTARYFVLLRYSLYNYDWYSSILPQGRESVDWSGSTNMQTYLKPTDRPNQWLFSLKIMTTSGSLVKSYSFSLQDLKLGDDNSWISTSYVELSAGMLYNISLTYESSSLNYGIPWPLLLDSFILMLDYNWASYFTTMSNVRIKNEIITCYTNSRALATTYNLPSQCGPHTFTIDLQLYNKALACNCFQPGSFSWTTCAEFGGQCHCKAGYGGRRCDQCIPGYYGNPTSGCLPCQCSPAGSLSNACNHITGQCLCKQNAHGLKCHECLHGFFHLSMTNPKGCQGCFGYGHLASCTTAVGFVRSYIVTRFTTTSSFEGWKLRGVSGQDNTNLLIKTALGMEYTDDNNMRRYFSAPATYLGDQLYSFGQMLAVNMEIYPILDRLANVDWHVRLIGNQQIALFKFREEISRSRTKYTILLHQNFMLGNKTLSEFDFKAMLGQLTALHIGVVYFEAPVTVTVKEVMLYSAKFMPSNTNISLMMNYIENARCLQGYKGLSCETCAPGYTRVIPRGGPLVNCVPCACNNRSTTCDPSTGACSNCRAGTEGNYCEKCLPNVMEPGCDRCKPGFWGLFTQVNGCKPCNCYLPGTDGGNNNDCGGFRGQCVCNKTLNVGGRQCNVCKENAYNISLGDDLRCQECPVCYGLIENSVLLVRKNIFEVQLDISNVMMSLSARQIIPFLQGITSMQGSLDNLTLTANAAKATLTGLDFLWQSLENKINVFLTTLQGSTVTKMYILLNGSNAIFAIHNTTVYQYSNIYSLLISSHNLVNITVRARMLQQIVALNQLNNLANEMTGYVTMATTNANSVSTKKEDLIQKIQLSINAASQAANMALTIRYQAFNLTSTLTPVHTRGTAVQVYAQTCIVSIQKWITESTNALAYAQKMLSSIAISIPDNSVNITALKAVTTSLSDENRAFTTKIFRLTNDVNAVAMEITKLKASLLLTRVSSAERRSSIYNADLRILKNKSDGAVATGQAVFSEATSMLNTVRNFMTVAAQAQSAANQALTKVNSVRSSVEFALSTVLSISSQIQAPKQTATQALTIMNEAYQLSAVEHTMVMSVYQKAISLRTQTESAQMLVQGAEIRNYIDSQLQPLLTQCSTYKTQSTTALTSAQNALSKAQQAHQAALTTAQKISVLSTNINNLQTITTVQLDNLLLAINRVRIRYTSLGLTTGITRLRAELVIQTNKINSYRLNNINLRAKIQSYKLVHQSLTSMTC